MKVSVLLAYFAGGNIVQVKQSVDGVEYDEPVAIPKALEASILTAVNSAVREGMLWLTNGPMSFCAEEAPAGAVSKTAILRVPPSPVALTALTPEELPDAWSEGQTTALSLWNAASERFAPPGVTLPWKSISTTITNALNSRYIVTAPGGAVPWPCEAHSAASVSFLLPSAAELEVLSSGPGRQGSGFTPANLAIDAPVAMAVLDSAALSMLADAIVDVQGAVAGYGVPLSFRVTVEADGLPPEGCKALRAELAKAVKAFQTVACRGLSVLADVGSAAAFPSMGKDICSVATATTRTRPLVSRRLGGGGRRFAVLSVQMSGGTND